MYMVVCYKSVTFKFRELIGMKIEKNGIILKLIEG